MPLKARQPSNGENKYSEVKGFLNWSLTLKNTFLTEILTKLERFKDNETLRKFCLEFLNWSLTLKNKSCIFSTNVYNSYQIINGAIFRLSLVQDTMVVSQFNSFISFPNFSIYLPPPPPSHLRFLFRQIDNPYLKNFNL